MTIGPLEIALIGFEGNKFQGEIAPELTRLQANGTIRIIDLVFAAKDKVGNVIATEIEDLDESYEKHFGGLAADLRGLLTEEDVVNVGLELPDNSAGLIVLFEHRWAVSLKDAVERAGGSLLGQARISADVMDELAVELQATLAS